MQTFMPYPDFRESVRCLDNKRLGKQRVEAFQILKVINRERTTGGFINHPIMKMWMGHTDALVLYMNMCIEEWIYRGFNNTMKILSVDSKIMLPKWIGDERVHSSHRANLLRKDYTFYSKYGWKENNIDYNSAPYFWSEECGWGKSPNKVK